MPPSRIEVPFGAPNKTSVYVTDSVYGEKDFTDYLIYWDGVFELNKLSLVTLTFVGLAESDFTEYMKRRNTFKFFAEHYFAGKFRIEEVKRKENYLIEVKGIGMGITLQDAITDQSTYVYDSTASDTIVTALCTEMTVQTNEDLGKVTGSFSWEDKLSALTTIANYFQADSWVDQAHPYDTDKFYIKQRRGRIPTVRNYYDSGSNRNATISKKINTEFHVNDIVLRGKRDMLVRMEASYVDSALTTAGTGITGWVKESNKIVVYISSDQASTTCYLIVKDAASTEYKLQEISVAANRDVSMTVDISSVKMGGVWGKPTTFGLVFVPAATASVTLYLGRTMPVLTQFSAVCNYYTKLDADLSVPIEGTPFDISCQDSVWFPSRGIVRIGSDPIGYIKNEGNVLWACIPDVASGTASAHRANVMIFPTYDGSDQANTFLTSTCSESATTLYVQDTTGFASSGSLIISDEVITYTGKTATTFTGCTKGATGTQGGSKPHSKYCRIFQYDSTYHYTTSSPKTGSVIESEGLKSGKYYDRSLEDITTAETSASSIMEANLDENVIAEGGIITVVIEVDDPWAEMQQVGLGDTIYVNSTVSNLDGNYRIKKIRWYFNPKYGHKMIIEAGSKKSLFVEKLMSKWKLLAD